MDGEALWVAPPEYVIVRKLEYFAQGGSDKHARDIRFMLAVTEIDHQRIQREVNERGLERE
jgi:hypothetical protein